jgi:hypothetical protein
MIHSVTRHSSLVTRHMGFLFHPLSAKKITTTDYETQLADTAPYFGRHHFL